LPIVFLTGTPDAAPRGELEAVGPREVLSKPIAPAVLAETVRRILEGPTPA
jgi:CheY-like chemotaxis protein